MAENETGQNLDDRLKVMIASPCTDMVTAGYALDLSMLYGFSLVHGLDCAIVQNRGTIIPQQRATLVEHARAFEATHILFIDSDMRFPKTALLHLLQRAEPIVAVNYPRRRHPVLPTAEKRGDGDKVFLFTTPESTGLEEAILCGFGMMLIDMTVFDTIPEPWFQIGYTSNDGQYVGEDFFFCSRARKAGYKILIDHDLSQDIRHEGMFAYTHTHCEEVKAGLERSRIEVVSGA